MYNSNQNRVLGFLLQHCDDLILNTIMIKWIKLQEYKQ